MLRYLRSATRSSLDGSHNLPTARIAITSAQGTVSRPAGISRSSNSSSLSAHHSNLPSQTAPNARERFRQTLLSCIGTDSHARSLSNKHCCESVHAPAVIVCASALVFVRPRLSNSPSFATVCCTTLRPWRTEQTSRQYTCVLPSPIEAIFVASTVEQNVDSNPRRCATSITESYFRSPTAFQCNPIAGGRGGVL